MTAALLLILTALLVLVLALFQKVILLNRSQDSLWDVLRRVEARRDEEARAAALLAARLETSLAQAQASLRLLEYGLSNGQARTLEALAGLAAQAQTDRQVVKESMQALEQRLSEAQAQIHDAALKRLEAQEAESKVRDDELGRRVTASLEQIKTSALETEKSMRSLESRLSKAQGRMLEALLERLEAHQAPEALADSKAKKPGAPDFGFHQRTESENLEMAKSLVFVRPLVPYPGWRFDAELKNGDFAFQMRRQLWCYFNSRRLELPLEMEWYDGLRINVYLGNDLSKQLFIGGCFEPNEFALLDRVLRPGMTFVDAGANDGLYTLFASRRVGPSGEVWAFEPSEREFARLERNLELNQSANVRLFREALSNCDGEGELVVGGYEHEGQNTLGAFIYDIELLRKERVPLRRLDDLVAEQHLSRVDLIKADVEGAEFRVFEGARMILEKMRPIVLFELSEKALNNQGASSADLLALLRSLNYRIYSFDKETGQPMVTGSQPLSDNLVGAPSEKPLPVMSTVA